MIPTTPLSGGAPEAVTEPGTATGGHQPLSRQIGLLIDTIGDRPIRLREIIFVLQGSSYLMLLILLSVPFCFPILLLGFSTPFGAVIAIIGLRLALRKEPWLPERILNVQMSAKLATKLLRTSQKSIRMLEKMLRPRWTYIVDPPVYHHLYGAIIFSCGALLLLPLPIPFSNVLPALPVILLAGALLERDGQFACAGVAMFLINILFFGAIFAGGGAVIGWLEAWFSG
ncbi:MAG: exopolysaccharide biosynthesis protein, partial [Verrucomicrobium sp.]